MKSLAGLLLIPVAFLAVVFAAGVLVGVALLAALPVTRRLVARQAAELQRQAEALQRWQTIVTTYRPIAATTHQGGVN